MSSKLSCIGPIMKAEDQKSTQLPDNRSLQIPDHRPPPYVALATPYNLGIHKLMYLDQIKIQQTMAMFASNHVVISKDDELIFNVKEEATGLEIELGGQDRAFTINLYDEREHLAISLKRDHKRFRNKKMQVFVGQELVSKVRLKKAYFGRLLHINDTNDKTVFTVSGPFFGLTKYKFDLFTLSKQCIGSITKTWRGLGNELFNDAEEYHIEFPMDLDVRYKAAVIGTCILIDVHYYSTYIRDSIRW